MILTPEEIKIVKDFLAPAVKNGLLLRTFNTVHI